MDNESKQLLKDINESLKDMNSTINSIEYWNDCIANSQFIDKSEPANNSRTSNSDLNLQILSLIFGFLVGFCLIKSFFDGYKI